MKKRATFYIKEETMQDLRLLSKNTRVAITLYVQEAVENLLKKYRTEVDKSNG